VLGLFSVGMLVVGRLTYMPASTHFGV